MKNRYLTETIENLSFHNQKMAFVSGPRQCGKTTLAKFLLKKRDSGKYCTWDEREIRKLWVQDPKLLIQELNYYEKPLLVLDEIHKNRFWKRDVKGLYDTLAQPTDILVTGSARLSAYNKGSDSLFGRYYHYRLHPFSLRELISFSVLSPEDCFKIIFQNDNIKSSENADNFESLLTFSGFPEPLFAQNEQTLRLWQRTRQERVIREDLRDLSKLPELGQIEMLTALLPERVATPIQKQKFVNLMESSHGTIKRWLTYLRELYYLYELKPFYNDIKSSLKKEGKLFLWDYSEIKDEADRFENLVANHLLKACHYWTDLGYGNFELMYLRNKQGKEIDFLITKDTKPWLPVEAKLTSTELSPNWKFFLPQLKLNYGLQIVGKHKFRKIVKVGKQEVLVASASDVLLGFP